MPSGASGKSFYVVWKGRQTGVFTTWKEAENSVKGFPGALYKGYPSREEAEEAWKAGPPSKSRQKRLEKTPSKAVPTANSPGLGIAVDGACNMVTGAAEYRGVNLMDGQLLFHGGPFPHATNNIVEFLALVHALAYCQKHGFWDLPVYSDSQTALAWVRKKKANTRKAAPATGSPVHDLIRKAEEWLQRHHWRNPLLKWDTAAWGEIPADFGRK
ncbi:MAG: ribonuclease H family protein [Flavobacteriales bacterium]|nr:ribonuclease H family protein [Flavobacteriales bacterium]